MLTTIKIIAALQSAAKEGTDPKISLKETATPEGEGLAERINEFYWQGEALADLQTSKLALPGITGMHIQRIGDATKTGSLEECYGEIIKDIQKTHQFRIASEEFLEATRKDLEKLKSITKESQLITQGEELIQNIKKKIAVELEEIQKITRQSPEWEEKAKSLIQELKKELEKGQELGKNCETGKAAAKLAKTAKDISCTKGKELIKKARETAESTPIKVAGAALCGAAVLGYIIGKSKRTT